MNKHTATIAGWVALGLCAAGLTGLEISQGLGGNSVDDRLVRQPVHRVVIDARDGDVRLLRRASAVRVRVHRHHVINTPHTTQRVSDGVLTLKTTCTIGFLPCRSDYRVEVPAGVGVQVKKSSGEVDAVGVGGPVTDVQGDSPALSVTAR